MATSLLPIVAGVLARSLWTIPLFGVLFSLAYVVKRRVVWRPLLADGMSVRLIAMLLSTFCVQFAIVAVLYGIGYTIDAIVGNGADRQALGATDLALALLMVAAIAIEATVGTQPEEGK